MDADDRNDIDQQLAVLHDEISKCRVCEVHVADFQKPPRLDRGEPGKVMVIGQGPGSAEMQGSRAFAGQSGRTLDKWFVECGNDPETPRAGIYFTSVLKCGGPENAFAFMASKCRHFLQRQILLVRPALVITLGRHSYEALRTSEESYREALCKLVDTAQNVLVTPFGFHYSLLHWPHPSGLNHWHNSPRNKERLKNSFEYVKTFLKGQN